MLKIEGGILVKLSDLKPTTKRKKWGLGILIWGLLGAYGMSQTFGLDDLGNFLFFVGSNLAFAAFGWFLLTSKTLKRRDDRREDKKMALRDQELEQELGALEKEIQSELEVLKEATGAKAFISHTKLKTLLDRTQTQNKNERLMQLLNSINFQESRIQSTYIGSLHNLRASQVRGDGKIHIYKDWVIVGDRGWDFDISTRGEVTLEGSVQFVNNAKHDTRATTLQLATKDWSEAFQLFPSQANEARRILNQLSAIIDDMKPKGATVLDVEAAMGKLVDGVGKSQAERLEELSNLRYQRLLTDAEFESAKKKILDI